MIFASGVCPGGDNLGVKTPPSMKVFLNLLGFLERKIKMHPSISKKFKTPPQKISGYAHDLHI